MRQAHLELADTVLLPREILTASWDGAEGGIHAGDEKKRMDVKLS